MYDISAVTAKSCLFYSATQVLMHVTIYQKRWSESWKSSISERGINKKKCHAILMHSVVKRVRTYNINMHKNFLTTTVFSRILRSFYGNFWWPHCQPYNSPSIYLISSIFEIFFLSLTVGLSNTVMQGRYNYSYIQ